MQRDCARSTAGAAHQKPARGAKRGANGEQCRATPNDIERLKPLVEPHPATLRYGKFLYGMQKVRATLNPDTG
jgi:hypothetical protein